MPWRTWILLTCLLSSTGLGAGDWPTFAHDPQRSGWASEERQLSKDNVAHLRLEWQVQLENEPKELTALTAPVIVTGVATADGVKDLVYIAGSSNVMFALDADTGALVWKQKLRVYASPVEKSTWLCPQGVNATPVADRKDGTLYVIASDGKLHRLDLGTGEMKVRPFQFVPPFSKNWSLNLVNGVLYTALSQGCGGAQSGIYALDVHDVRQSVVHFLYTSKRGSGGVWGRGGAVVGENGLVYAAAGDGPFNAAEREFGSSVIAGRGNDLSLVDYFTPPNWDELNRLDLDLGSTTPVWFREGERDLLAVGAKEAVVYLMDANVLGGKDHSTPLFTTPRLSNDEQSFEAHGIWGSLSTWKDPGGQRWLYVPAWGPVAKEAPEFPIRNGPNPSGSVMAFRVTTDPASRKPKLDPAWISGDMSVPEPVAIANGVVFALSNGENVRQTDRGGKMDWEKLKTLETSERMKGVQAAVLYALDAATGKVLYSSGDAIRSWTHFSAPVVANGRVYVVDHDSRVYAFGLAQKP